MERKTKIKIDKFLLKLINNFIYVMLYYSGAVLLLFCWLGAYISIANFGINNPETSEIIIKVLKYGMGALFYFGITFALSVFIMPPLNKYLNKMIEKREKELKE